jgi:hypothetical protein
VCYVSQELEGALQEIEEASREAPQRSQSTASNMTEMSSGSGMSKGLLTTSPQRQASGDDFRAVVSGSFASPLKTRLGGVEEVEGGLLPADRSGKRVISEYTNKFQQIMEASLRASSIVRLLPSEFDEINMDMSKVNHSPSLRMM